MNSPLLEVNDLHVYFGNVHAVRGVSLQVASGEVVCIIGANGAGKTATLSAVCGLVKPRRGSVRLRGADVTGHRASDLVGRGLVLVPEGRQVLAQMTVRENLELGGYRRSDRRALQAEVLQMMERFPILGRRRGEPAGALSGGEQQMLALARGLLAAPSLLLLDEPSMGLAPRVVSQIFGLLRGLRQEGRTVLLVEQNARRALQISDRVYVMESGRVVLEAEAARLLGDPRLAAAYLGGTPVELSAEGPVGEP